MSEGSPRDGGVDAKARMRWAGYSPEDRLGERVPALDESLGDGIGLGGHVGRVDNSVDLVDGIALKGRYGSQLATPCLKSRGPAQAVASQ